MKRWIIILVAALCLVVLLFGCGAQNLDENRPSAPARDGSKILSETTEVENIVPDEKTPVEVPAQNLTEAEPAADAQKAEAEEAKEEVPAPEKTETEKAPAAEETEETENAVAAEAEEESSAADVAELAEENAAVDSAEEAEEVPPAEEPEASRESQAEEAEAAEEPLPAEEAEAAEEPLPAEEAEPAAETISTEFLKITGLNEVEESLEAGETIIGITYTEGLGESADWFYTTDPWEIQDLWTALQMIETDGASKWFATDWYPSVELYLSDLSVYRVAFNGHWLDTPENNYQLKNDEMFWSLATLLKEKYKETALEEEDDVFYVPNSVDLYFPANPTTGYTWTAEVADEGIIAVEEQYFEDSHALGMTGVGGTQWFHFDGLTEGNTSVTISYQRSWEGNEPLYVFVYRLSVDEENNVMIWGVEMNPEMD